MGWQKMSSLEILCVWLCRWHHCLVFCSIFVGKNFVDNAFHFEVFLLGFSKSVYVVLWQEFYADYFAIDPFHFTLNLPANHLCMLPTVSDPHLSQLACDRMLDGIAAVFLSLKKRPVIRYERSSEIARRVAQDAAVSMPFVNSAECPKWFMSRMTVMIEI